MKKIITGFLLILMLSSAALCQQMNRLTPASENSLRAPAYPLLTIDPYMSIWSFSDKLYDENVRHWTGTSRSLIGVLMVDGKPYRFMGTEEKILDPVAYTADLEQWIGRFTEEKPAVGWEKTSFDDSGWKEGKGAFGSRGASVGTRWRSKDLWVRREVNLTDDQIKSDLAMRFSHDDMLELYINGKPVVRTGNNGRSNVVQPLTAEVKNALVSGKNIIAAHCNNEAGPAYLDFGIFKDPGIKKSFETAAVQKSAVVMPTQTYYRFECGPILLDVVLTSPLLMNDPDLLSRPVNYISWQVKSLDGKKHDVKIYIEATPEFAVNTINQPVKSEMFTQDGLTYLKTGTIEQPVLAKKGDDLRIDWGYFYMVTKPEKAVTTEIGEASAVRQKFISSGKLSNSTDSNLPQKMFIKMTALSFSRNHGKVGSEAVNGYLMTGYDDILSIQYFGENLPAYWTKDGTVNIKQAFTAAGSGYPSIIDRCNSFDKSFMTDAEKAGGKKYAELAALTYRQSIAAHKLVRTKSGELLFLSKENFSNGCINTVDVTYPSAPLYLLYNPDLLKGMLNGIFYYSESGKWTKPFAAHDLGTYPIANGQVYREDMPVEEAGNMLILTTAIAVVEGNAKYAEKHWDVLSTWANYLIENGLDPANQLCTDDFAGHLAHNANLSVKAIMGIAGYGKLASMLGKKDIAGKYTGKAREMAKEWIRMSEEGDHFKLTFDQSGTWSQKYNLIWDKILKLEIFPKEVAQKEIAYYLTKQNTYGLPLDSRKTYTKSDWIMWTATLAENQSGFSRLIDPVWKYANETSTRMPLSDWHETTDGRSVGFRARSVVGGYHMKMLEMKLR